MSGGEAHVPTVHFHDPARLSGTACGRFGHGTSSTERRFEVTCQRCRATNWFEITGAKATLSPSYQPITEEEADAPIIWPVTFVMDQSPAAAPGVDNIGIIEFLMDALGVSIADIANRRGV